MMATQLSLGLCQAEIERQLGFRLSTDQAHQLERLVGERARRSKSDPSSYVTQTLWGDGDNELLSLAAEFTIGESFFFRDLAQLRLCCDAIVESVRDGAKVRVLSAGCSSGEEPYSLLMLLSERLPLERVEVVALDISSRSLQHAQRATYSAWQLRETPEHLKAQWFSVRGRDFQLTPEIVGRVQFVQGSLAVTSTPLPGAFDVVVCRNVLMYFSSEQYRLAVQRLIDSIADRGYLFLGHAENVRGLGLALELVHRSDSFCYRKSAPEAAIQTQLGANPLERGFGNGELQRSATSAWSRTAEEVSPSADEVRLGCSSPSTLQAVMVPPFVVYPVPAAQATSLTGELGALRDVNALLRAERYVAALALLEQGDIESAVPRLCRAMLLVYTNQFARARDCAFGLIDDNRVAAGAHYALTLCHEFAAEWPEATHHAHRAAYLDPTFAMPRLHLGIASRRKGEGLAARRELLQARALLRVEPAERLLWFGGGCSRATLLQECERELAAVGVQT